MDKEFAMKSRNIFFVLVNFFFCLILSIFSTNCYASTVAGRCNFFVENEKYQEASVDCKKAAEQGNVVAQFNLGSMHEKGYGVKQDYFEAFKWYQKAAKQG